MMMASALLALVGAEAHVHRPRTTVAVPGGAGGGRRRRRCSWSWSGCLSLFALPATAVVLYLHVATFGGALVSGFWSLVNERFDPYTARQVVGRIGTGAAAGGLVGGLLALLGGPGAPGPGHAPGAGGPERPRGPRPAPRSRAAPAASRSGERAPRPWPFRSSPGRPTCAPSPSSWASGAVIDALLDFLFKARTAELFVERGRDDDGLRPVPHRAGPADAAPPVDAGARAALDRLGLAGTVALRPAVDLVTALLGAVVPALRHRRPGPRGSRVALQLALPLRVTSCSTPPSWRPRSDGSRRSSTWPSTRREPWSAARWSRSSSRWPPARRDSRLFALAAGVSLLTPRALSPAPPRLRRGPREEPPRRAGAARARGRPGPDHPADPRPHRRDRARGAAGPDRGAARDDRVGQRGRRRDRHRRARRAGAGLPGPIRSWTTSRACAPGGGAGCSRCSRPTPSRRRSSWPASSRSSSKDQVYPEVVRALRRVAHRSTGQLVDALLDPRVDPVVRRRIPRVLKACPTPRSADGLRRALERHRLRGARGRRRRPRRTPREGPEDRRWPASEVARAWSAPSSAALPAASASSPTSSPSSPWPSSPSRSGSRGPPCGAATGRCGGPPSSTSTPCCRATSSCRSGSVAAARPRPTASRRTVEQVTADLRASSVNLKLDRPPWGRDDGEAQGPEGQ